MQNRAAAAGPDRRTACADAFQEAGPQGVTVDTVPPGFTDTPMTRRNEAKGLSGGPAGRQALLMCSFISSRRVRIG